MDDLQKHASFGYFSLFEIACLLLVPGCGGASHELETAAVSGTVKIDGRPLSSGYVYVLPSKGRMAKGIVQEDGSFVLGTYESDDGAQVGTHSVIVVPVPADEGSRKPDRSSVKIPRKYAKANNSGLTATVKSGDSNLLELDLQSD